MVSSTQPVTQSKLQKDSGFLCYWTWGSNEVDCNNHVFVIVHIISILYTHLFSKYACAGWSRPRILVGKGRRAKTGVAKYSKLYIS